MITSKKIKVKFTLIKDKRRVIQTFVYEIKFLVQQEKHNKFTTRFNPIPFTVVKKHGNNSVFQSDEGGHYTHNTSHSKKFIQSIRNSDEQETEIETE